MKKRLGLSLAETLVAASLALLLLGLGFQLWRFEQSAWKRLAECQEAQSSCLCAAQAVRHDFAGAVPDSLKIRRLSGDFEFGFLVSDELWTDEGEARPQGWVLYRYQAASQTLERLTAPPEGEALPVWAGRGHIVARHLDRAELSSLHPNHLSLECHSQVGTQASGTRIRVFPRAWSGPAEEIFPPTLP